MSDTSPDHGPGIAPFLVVGVSGEGAGPGDVAMAGRVEGVAAFVEDPAGAGVNFAEGEVVGGDVLVRAGEALFAIEKLVHKSEAQVVFLAGEINFEEAAAEFASGFPTDLASEPRLVTGTLNGGEFPHEIEEGGFEKIPVFGSNGEQTAEPQFAAFGFIDVEGAQVALAAGCDIKAEAILRLAS